MANGRSDKLGYIPWTQPENYLNINWKPDDQHNRLAEPFTPITQSEFESILLCNSYSLEGINFDQVYFPGSVRQGFDLWSVHYYMFREECVAVLERPIHNEKKLPNPLPMNAAICERPNYYKFIMYFYKIGCTHPNLKHTTPVMFEQVYTCPDCGFKVSHDSSG